MKTLAKILTALAAIAGVIYIVATYGQQIVDWAKKVLESLPKCPCCQKDEEVEEILEEAAEEAAPAEEAPAAAEETPAEEAPAEEPATEVVVAANEPVADDKDFAE